VFDRRGCRTKSLSTRAGARRERPFWRPGAYSTPQQTGTAGNGATGLIIVFSWPPLVELGGHRPTDQIYFFLCPNF